MDNGITVDNEAESSHTEIYFFSKLLVTFTIILIATGECLIFLFSQLFLTFFLCRDQKSLFLWQTESRLDHKAI